VTTPLRDRLQRAAAHGVHDALRALPQPERDQKFIRLTEGETHLDIDARTGWLTMWVDNEVFLWAPVETIVFPQAAVSA
jgi:hypothetical protein